MMSKIVSMLLLSCVFLLARGAPIKQDTETSLADKGSSVQVKSTDEEELHNLKSKVPEVTKQGLSIVKTVTSSEKVINGQKESSSNAETKVLKPGTGKLIADVKVASQGHQNGNEAPEVETEVDIPDQGIAQKFKGYGKDEVPVNNPMAFTPKAVAEYLLVSGDLDGFFSSLEELVGAKVMSVDDAKSYEMAVEREYQLLLSELEQPDEMDYYDSLNFNRPDKREDDTDVFNIDSMARRVNLQNAIEKEEAYAELAQALVKDYMRESEVEDLPYENVIDGMNPQEVDNVIDLLADAIVSDELEREPEVAIPQPEMPQEEDDSEEAELDEIAQSMGQAPEVPEKEEGTEADVADNEKKSRTSQEAKETDDKKAKKGNDETIPAKKV
ncbi:uncharacterized protein LOC135498928 isoform X2 [Lineus longissimus]|uniref:uncharacterized protein LOC135498928 isoform X2 n=1 Tax=Lineus longissimus TaxID=88925 RepID=UPI00315C9958